MHLLRKIQNIRAGSRRPTSPLKPITSGLAMFMILTMATGLFLASDLSGTAYAATVNLHYQLQPYISIGSPWCVGSADFNNDGYEDLVVTSNDSSTKTYQLRILLGSIDGLISGETYNLGRSGYGLDIYDINLDGTLDIAVAKIIDHEVMIFLGVGDGTFTIGGSYSTADSPADSPLDVVAADFNGDGIVDLATGNNSPYDDYTVSILFGISGSFGFSAPIYYEFSEYSYDLVAADFDQDGDIDLAVTAAEGLIYILDNDGAGNFGTTFETYNTGGFSINSIVCGDFNEDFYPDLAITTRKVCVYLNNRDGTFAERQEYGSFSNYMDLAVKDLNGDGQLDLVSNNIQNYRLDQTTIDEIEVLLGNGDGTFRQEGSWAITASDSSSQFGNGSLTVGDYNGDGLPDIASGTDFDNDVVTVLEAYIVPVTATTVTPPELELDDGSTANLTIAVSPVDASNPAVIWSSDDETVVQVDSNGVVTAVGPGSATVTAQSVDNSEIFGTCEVTVNPVLVTGISLNTDVLTLRVGNARTLIAEIEPSYASHPNVIWSSDDELIAKVNGNGVVTAVAVGSATITATSEDNPDVYSTCEITVIHAPPTPVPVFTEAATLYGDNRLLTAIAISKALSPETRNALVLARADNYPDALTGVPLAYALDAPLLLTYPDQLDSEVAQEIDRNLGGSGTIYVLGGETAVSTAVTNILADEYEVIRLMGNNRYQTAVNIAEALTSSPISVFLVTGQDFPDAVSISSIAARLEAPILLTDPDSLPTATADYLEANSSTIENVYVVGGTGAISEDVYNQAGGTERISGFNRWATSAAVAHRFFPAPTLITLSTGRNFPDSLTGGVLAAVHNAPILITQPSFLPSEIEAYIEQVSAGISDVYVFGGPSAVNPSVYSQLDVLLK